MSNKNKNPYQEFEDKGYTVKVYKNWADYQNQKSLAKEKQEKLKQIAQSKEIKKENQLRKDDMSHKNNLIYNPDLKWALKRREIYKQNPDLYKRIAELGGGNWEKVDAETIFNKAGGPKPSHIAEQDIAKSKKEIVKTQRATSEKITTASGTFSEQLGTTLWDKDGLQNFDTKEPLDREEFIYNLENEFLGKNSSLGTTNPKGWSKKLKEYLTTIFPEFMNEDNVKFRNKLINIIKKYEDVRRGNNPPLRTDPTNSNKKKYGFSREEIDTFEDYIED
mgnify:CR=1 FL=1